MDPMSPTKTTLIGVHTFNVFFKKKTLGLSWPLSSFIFGLFQTNITIFTTNKCGKSPSSKWYRDSNPMILVTQPFDQESPAPNLQSLSTHTLANIDHYC